MKENSTTADKMHQNPDSTSLGFVQKHCTQLACKENIGEGSEVGLGSSIHVNMGHLRQKQQLPLPNQPMQQLEINGEDYIAEQVLTPGSGVSLEYENLETVPAQGPRVRARRQTHQACKIRISQLMPCETLDYSSISPLPQLQWVQSADLWRTMRSKDISKVAPEAELRLHHPGIISSMRTILLDWMMEVYIVNYSV